MFENSRLLTVLSDEQLQILQTVYNQTPRPDALVKEELVRRTGLNSRVIRVWFQNKRLMDQSLVPTARHFPSNPDQAQQTPVRTVLTDEQLQILRAAYSQTPRPDALMKEELVRRTGLNCRVIRLWFQNERCEEQRKSQLSM